MFVRFFLGDRYAGIALGSYHETGGSLADLDIHVSGRGLSQTVIPEIDGCDEDERQTLLARTQLIWHETFGTAEEFGSLAPRQNSTSATNCSGWC